MIAKVESPAMLIVSSGSIWTATRSDMLPPVRTRSRAASRAALVAQQLAGVDAGRDAAVGELAAVVAAHHHRLGVALGAGRAGGVECDGAEQLVVLVGTHLVPRRGRHRR